MSRPHDRSLYPVLVWHRKSTCPAPSTSKAITFVSKPWNKIFWFLFKIYIQEWSSIRVQENPCLEVSATYFWIKGNYIGRHHFGSSCILTNIYLMQVILCICSIKQSYTRQNAALNICCIWKMPPASTPLRRRSPVRGSWQYSSFLLSPGKKWLALKLPHFKFGCHSFPLKVQVDHVSKVYFCIKFSQRIF